MLGVNLEFASVFYQILWRRGFKFEGIAALILKERTIENDFIVKRIVICEWVLELFIWIESIAMAGVSIRLNSNECNGVNLSAGHTHLSNFF